MPILKPEERFQVVAENLGGKKEQVGPDMVQLDLQFGDTEELPLGQEKKKFLKKIRFSFLFGVAFFKKHQPV